MKIAHVSNYAPGFSGMYGTVRDLLKAERGLGHQAEIIDDADGYNILADRRDDITPVSSMYGYEADIICWHHAMYEDFYNEPHRNLVLFLHGTPEFNYFGEIYAAKERSLSLILGLANLKIPKAFVCMWKRHIPFWENLIQAPVNYVPIWANVQDFTLSPLEPDPNVIRIAMVDFWRVTREPFGLFAAIDYLRRTTNKKIEVNVWGLTDDLRAVDKAVVQWLVEDDIVTLCGNTRNVMQDIYHQNDLVLTMSTEETRVVREAYSCGMPVVCGRHGLHFTEYAEDCIHPQRLAEAIDRCHSDLCADVKATRNIYRNYAETYFDVQASAQRVVKIFEKVIEEHGSPNAPHVIKSEGVRMVAGIDDTANKIRDRIENGDNVCYVRCGDGDLLLINGADGESFHQNSPELREELTDAFTFKDPDFLVGSVAGMLNEKRMRNGLFARFEYDDTLRKVVEELRPGETLENPIALLYKFVFEPIWFVNFVRSCIHTSNVLFIGPESGEDSELLKAVFDWDEYISVPEKDAYYALDAEDKKLFEKIQQSVENHNLVICAAGMATRVIAKRLWAAGNKCAFLDIGSMVDCLLGNNTRTWIKMVREDVLPIYYDEFIGSKIEIAVLSHKHSAKTIRCFDSVANTMNNYHVWWVDNGSGDECVERVSVAAKKLADCDLVRIPNNVGFARGVNQALRRIIHADSSDYVLLLNNDAVLTKNCVGRMRLALEANGLSAIAPVASENNPHSLEALSAVCEGLPTFESDDMQVRADMLWKKFGTQCLVVENMISFFCCLLKRSAIEQIGLLDENLFAYGEDNDYCMRMRRMGHTIGIALGAYAHHDHGVTSNSLGKDWAEEKKKEAQIYLKKKYQLA